MFNFNTVQILIAVLAFIRIGGIVFVLPVFGDDPVPVRVRILLSVALTIGIYPIILSSWDVSRYQFTNEILTFVYLIFHELLIGLSLGYLSRLAFQASMMAASLVGYQMGFGTSGLFLPTSEDRHNGFTAFNQALIVLIFLSLDYHHIYIQTISDTFKFIPLGARYPTESLTQIVINTSAGVIVSAIQLAAPVLVSILFSTAALGLIARTVPQVNVFVISFPVGFYIGLLVYVATLPFLPGWLEAHFGRSQQEIMQTIVSYTKRS